MAREPSTNPFAAIPEIGGDLDSFRRALVAMKQNIEILTSQRGSVGAVKQTIIYRQKEGAAVPIGLNDGDEWWQPPVVPGEDWQLSLWWNGKWTRI